MLSQRIHFHQWDAHSNLRSIGLPVHSCSISETMMLQNVDTLCVSACPNCGNRLLHCRPTMEAAQHEETESREFDEFGSGKQLDEEKGAGCLDVKDKDCM